ncbi:MAG: glycoside hydrolase family 140 protein [Bacteroidales bacterium]
MKTIFSILFTFILFPAFSQNLQPLKISEDDRYLVTQDNDPFFWLGGTAWEMIHRLNREEIDHYLEDRAAKGFTIVQTVILAELDGLNTPNAYGDKPLINNDPTQINESYFEHVDYLVKKADELGIYVGLLPTWGDKFNKKWGVGPEIFTPENAEVFGEILAKRYMEQGNIIWVLGGDRPLENKKHRSIIKSMARGIRNVDTQKLITYHPPGAQKATNFFNDPLLDVDMLQTGHDRKAREYNFVRESLEEKPKRPVINGESRYENIKNRFWEPGDHEWMDDSDVRKSAYWSFLSGAAGYTYGCNDIWQMYDYDHQPTLEARTGWREALNLPGSRHMMFMKNLFTSLPWQQLENDQKLILSENPENQDYIMSAIDKEKNFIIVYIPRGHEFQLDLSDLNEEDLKAYWFNPRSGELHFEGNYKSSDKPVFKPWSTGRGSDFVLVVSGSDFEL